jgi:transposase
MDLLTDHAEEVEKKVFFNTAHLFNLDVDIIFYDTTTASFSINQFIGGNEEDIRMFGHSKEGSWVYQAVVALAVTKEGIPVRSWVLPGNTQDVNTVETVKQDLRGWNLGRCLFVADAGINSNDNRKELAKACGRYILATRVGSVKEIKEDVLNRPGRFRKIADNLYAKQVIVGKGVRHRRYILCYNPKEAKRQSEHRESILGKLVEILASHKDHKADHKWAIELLCSKRYSRYLKVDENGDIRIDPDKVKKAKRLDGKWVLITNDDTISVEDTAAGYKGLMIIERCFRTLKKSQIMMSPMYHRLAKRIDAHVKICVLALLLKRIIEIYCDDSWKKIYDKLDLLQVTEYRSSNHAFFRRNEIDPQTKDVFKKLDISIPKPLLSVKKMPTHL